MKSIFLLILYALAVSALPIDEEPDRLNGETGWYVPLRDGSFEWVSMEEAEEFLNKQEIDGRRDKNEVRFFLLTNEYPDDQQEIFPNKESIDVSRFNPKNPIRFTIHGWESSGHDEMHFKIAEGWFTRGDYNIIAVDWKKARTVNYMSSVGYVSKVGKKVAAMINFLEKEYNVSLDDMQCIGHSLGAHTCGYTAKNTKNKIHTIVGLDPALPLFDYKKPALRLNSDDAIYVETIQTNGGKLGFLDPIGKSTFYPNGGKKQPGCGLDLTGACSHKRSYQYYSTAIKYNNFPSVKCSNYKNATKKDCGATYSSSRMCAASNFLLEGGDYYVPVSSQYPYGLADDVLE